MYSLYTEFHNYEIMFHVSTMLPYTPNNRQQVSDLSYRRITGNGTCHYYGNNMGSVNNVMIQKLHIRYSKNHDCVVPVAEAKYFERTICGAT